MENEKYTPIHSFNGVIGDNNRPRTQKSLDCVEVESRYAKDIVNAEKEQREDVFKKNNDLVAHVNGQLGAEIKPLNKEQIEKRRVLSNEVHEKSLRRNLKKQMRAAAAQSMEDHSPFPIKFDKAPEKKKDEHFADRMKYVSALMMDTTDGPDALEHNYDILHEFATLSENFKEDDTEVKVNAATERKNRGRK